MKRRKSIRTIRPSALVLVGVLLAIGILVFAYLEGTYERQIIRHLMLDKAVSIIDQVEKGAALAKRASDEIETELAKQLLFAAKSIIVTEKQEPISNQTLAQIALVGNFESIRLFDGEGNLTGSSLDETTLPSSYRALVVAFLAGNEPEAVLGIHKFIPQGKATFSVIARRPAGAVSVDIDAGVLAAFRKSFGFGRLLQDAAHGNDVMYLAIQDHDGIVAATKGVESLESIESDPILEKAWDTNTPVSRLTSWNGRRVFEVIKHVEIDPTVSGLLRIAIDTDELTKLETQTRTRLIILIVGLFLFLLVAVNALGIYQNMLTERRLGDEIETFSNAILKGMGDAVLVATKSGEVRMKNDKAAQFFGESPLDSTIVADAVNKAFTSQKALVAEYSPETDADLSRNIVMGISTVKVNEDGEPFAVLIARDETDLRRNEKVIAMGKLAGAVAHEVRNPLNAIGMTAQRLRLEYEPAEDREGYRAMLDIVSEEIVRLDGIIGQFLNFARAPVIMKQQGRIDELVQSIATEMLGVAESKGARLVVDIPDQVPASFDPKQLRQVLLNLTANALDAVDSGGTVSISAKADNTDVVLKITDNGRGMSEEQVRSAFDMYFTTKERGTGLGLPIARQIVESHGGVIHLHSRPGEGTLVTIRLPKEG